MAGRGTKEAYSIVLAGVARVGGTISVKEAPLKGGGTGTRGDWKIRRVVRYAQSQWGGARPEIYLRRGYYSEDRDESEPEGTQTKSPSRHFN